MNVSEPRPKAIYINIDLLFDFYSVLFSAYRTYFAKSSISINELKRTIEGRNLRNGLKSLLQEIPESFALDTVNQELKPFIDISLKSIKPNVNAFALVQNFVNNGSTVKVFTNFEDEVIKYVEEAHKDWFNFQVIKIENLSDLKINFDQEYQDNIVFIDSSVESCTNIKKEENIQVIYIPHSKRMLENFHQDENLKKELENLKITAKESLEDVEWDRIGVLNTIKWPETSYYLKLDSKPTNEAYNVWRNVSQLEQPIELTSKIVHGFGRGGKKLGIPTANLDMTSEIEEKLVDLVNGVYYGWAEFIVAGNSDNKEEMSYNQRLPMVMSIGFNPYFNNKYKTAEVHIMQKFDADFYDNTLKVEVLGFIRNEADFMKFSHLIEAIHNDVQVAKDILLQ